ncbi:hypothetical protein [Neochlamydia sp. AcF95]|nr:hypothetical protein [Neochlamydia sp. AcF95]MBS4170076.1 hypothetical protein [Neochlamydia sp. AcF95]
MSLKDEGNNIMTINKAIAENEIIKEGSYIGGLENETIASLAL